MTALAMLAAEVGVRAGRSEAQSLQSSLGELPKLVEAALSQEQAIQRWAQQAEGAAPASLLPASASWIAATNCLVDLSRART